MLKKIVLTLSLGALVSGCASPLSYKGASSSKQDAAVLLMGSNSQGQYVEIVSINHEKLSGLNNAVFVPPREAYTVGYTVSINHNRPDYKKLGPFSQRLTVSKGQCYEFYMNTGRNYDKARRYNKGVTDELIRRQMARGGSEIVDIMDESKIQYSYSAGGYNSSMKSSIVRKKCSRY